MFSSRRFPLVELQEDYVTVEFFLKCHVKMFLFIIPFFFFKRFATDVKRKFKMS